MKKIILPLITLVIGLVVGYFIERTISTNQVNELTHQLNTHNTLKTYSFINPKDDILKYSDAKTCITNFTKLNTVDINSGGGLFVDDPTQGKLPLEGFVIQRASLEDIIAKNKDWTGIRVYFAKHPSYPGNSDRIFTFIFTAALSSNTVGDPKNDVDATAPIYDHVYPCPTVCGSLGQ